jgi:hypothetical protein
MQMQMKSAEEIAIEIAKIAGDVETGDMIERRRNEVILARAYLALVEEFRKGMVAYKLSSTLETQEGGGHYKVRKIQPVEYWAANNLDAFQGAVVKYMTRWREKGGILDLKKVIHYTQIYIELMFGVRSRIEYDGGTHPLLDQKPAAPASSFTTKEESFSVMDEVARMPASFSKPWRKPEGEGNAKNR